MEIFRGLNDKTEILESLDWDESALEQLISFIDMQKECFTPTHPVVLINQVEDFFGKNTARVLEKILKREYQIIIKENNYEN